MNLCKNMLTVYGPRTAQFPSPNSLNWLSVSYRPSLHPMLLACLCDRASGNSSRRGSCTFSKSTLCLPLCPGIMRLARQALHSECYLLKLNKKHYHSSVETRIDLQKIQITENWKRNSLFWYATDVICILCHTYLNGSTFSYTIYTFCSLFLY